MTASHLRLHLTALGLALGFALAATPAGAAAPPPAPASRPLAQSTRERWTYRDGLPHNVVHRVLATRGGYLWIGSQEGLVRFDGVRFTIFTQSDSPGLASNEINALAEDAAGTVWIGTSLGLSRLTGGGLERVDLGIDCEVLDVTSDGAGGAWVATKSSGLLRLRAGPPARVERVGGLAGLQPTTLLRDGEALWVGGFGGLGRLAGGRLERVQTGWPGGRNVTSLARSPDGTLWIGTSAGLARLRPGGAAAPTQILGTTRVDALRVDRTGALWVGTETGPVYRVVGDLAEPVTGPASPSSAHALAEDPDGDLWIGTESFGLFRLRWGQAVTIATEEGLPSDVVWAVTERRSGGLWVATDGGLARIDGDLARPAVPREASGPSLGGLLEDRAGELWVGAADGIFRLGAAGLTRFGRSDGLDGSQARAFFEDRHGTLWVGSEHGLSRRVKGRFQPLAADPPLDGASINVLAEDAGGRLWAGTTVGLARVEGERLEPVLHDGRPIRADVTALRFSPDGALWFGTVSDGLQRLGGDRLERFTQREGLHEDTVYSLLDDGEGHLWMSGSHGISRLALAELEAVRAGRRPAVAPLVFGTADGMRERECNGGVAPAAWRAADGRLWFSTIRGAVVIDPARLEAPRGPPAARIEELVVDGRRLPPDAPLRLAPGPHRLEVRYTSLSLATADRARFRHRLAGLDDAFLDAGVERVAHFTNLGPGRYRFEVAAAGAAGAWGAPVGVAFEVEPHLWQTAWFQAALAVLALAAVVLGPLWRIRILRRRQALLAARVEEEVQKVKVLRGLLPTCAWCSKIKDEAGAWRRFEDYVSERTEASFTHGMCPACFERLGGDGEPPAGA